MEEIKIKNSKIHGKGMFANRDFKKGEIVTKHFFKYLTKEEYSQLSNEEKVFIGKDKERYIFFLPPSRYVNHSCQPNTFVKDNAESI